MNWFQRIKEARGRGYFDTADRRKASAWTTCACGEQDARIPRHEHSNVPEDFELMRLGMQFAGAVEVNYFDKAEETLHKIEARAAEVLATT